MADFKDFTYYPKELKPRFKQLKAPWTYMRESERMKTDFLRPRRWFKKTDYQKTKKQKIWGLTTSNGKIMAAKVESPFSADKFVALVRQKIGPFMKRAYRGKTAFQILVDNEKFMHAPESKQALQECGIKFLPKWPAHSPEINPQENVWPWAEGRLRELEKDNDTFEEFGDKVVQAIKSYPTPKKLITSMPKRMRDVIDAKGGSISS